jgi:hypothetical protein
MAVVLRAEEVYRCNFAWLVLLLASATILLAAGIASRVVAWRTYVPDMIGYMASVTFNNRYLPLPDHGGVLDAMDRARAMIDVRVGIGDVCGNERVGLVAFTSITDVRRLEKGRAYI